MDKKRAAAEAAIEMVEDGMVVGLGTGSTANLAIEGLGRRVAEGLTVQGVPTSKATERLARRVGITLVDLDQVDRIDLTIDGADEVDPNLDLIKGMGGALLREKVVAYHSEQEVIIVDDSKLVEMLGMKSPLPVEVAVFAHNATKGELESLGCVAMIKGGGAPFVTDNGNYIYECRFGSIEDARRLDALIRSIPGVIETGLFIGLATKAVVASDRGIDVRRRN